MTEKELFDKVIWQIKQDNELEHALNANPQLVHTTLKNYDQNYRKFMKKYDGKITDKEDEEDLIQVLREFDCAPKTKMNMLNVLLLIRRHFKLPVDKILHYRGYKKEGKYMGGELITQCHQGKIQKKIETDKDLPTKKELITYCNTLYKQNKLNEYIINYILVYYGVRNKDLDMEITCNSGVISNINKYVKHFTGNYPYLTDSYITLVINQYKTVSTYGRKTIRVKSKKMVKASWELWYEGQKKLLINPVSKTPVTDEAIGRAVKEASYNKIGEGRIFKAIIKDIFTNVKDIGERQKLLNQYSKSRGTEMNKIIKFYATGIPI